MTNETEQKNITSEKVTSDAKPVVADAEKKEGTTTPDSSSVRSARAPRKYVKNTRPRKTFERVKPEFDQKILDIRRVTRVVSGGRRFSFSVSLVAGDRNGRVGVGIGKAADTSLAIEKAFRNAKKNMLKIKLNKEMSIPHEVEAKLGSAKLVITPAPGKGIVAGSAVRNILDLLGAKDVGAKILSRSKNKLNIARATIKALQKL